MEGLELRGTGLILFLGELPRRKQHCFYFQDKGLLYPMVFPVAFVPSGKLEEAERLWARFIAAVPKERNDRNDR